MIPRLYSDIAVWWPLFSAPEHYAPEAAWILEALHAELDPPPRTMLELGSGGGNLASHLRDHVRLTLTDIAPGMLAHSRRLNPDAEHIEGDMRTIRLGRTFDAVLMHDAVMYMTTQDDLVAALTTAHTHLPSGGALIVLPDHVAETFEPGVETDGNDGEDGRSIRYLCWSHAPDPGASVQHTDYAILLRGADGSVEVVHDRHTTGLFARDTWREAFRRAGFSALRVVSDPWRHDVFIARRSDKIGQEPR